MSFRLKVLALFVAFAFVPASGCKKGGSDGAKGAAESALKAEVGVVAMPSDVLAFGGLKSLDDLTAAVAGIVTKFSTQLGGFIGAQIPAGLQGHVLGVKNLSWLDTQKPVKFVALDYKKFRQPILLILPVKAKDGLMAALPEGKASGEPDNETTYKTAKGETWYVNMLGTSAVFANEAKAFATVKAFLEGEFWRYEFTELLDAQVSGTNLQRLAGPDIAAASDQFSQMAAGPSRIPIPGIEKLLKEEFQMFAEALNQTETARLVVRYDGETLGLKGAIKVVEGKSFAKFAAQAKDRKMELYKSLPPGAWASASANVDPALFAGWTRLGTGFWADILKLDAAEKARLEALMEESMNLQTGDTAFALSREGDFPLKMISVVGVKDGGRAKTAAYAIWGLLFSKLGSLIESTGKVDTHTMPRMDWSSFTAFINGLKPILAEAGVTANIRTGVVGSNIQVDALELVVDYTKLPEAGAHAPTVARVSKTIGNTVVAAMGFDGGHMYFAFGKDGVGDIGRASQGGGGQQISDIIAKSETTPAMVLYLSFVDLMKIIAQFDSNVLRAMPGLETAKADAGFTFILGARDGRLIDASFTVPLGQIASVMPKQSQGGMPLSPAPARGTLAPIQGSGSAPLTPIQ